MRKISIHNMALKLMVIWVALGLPMADAEAQDTADSKTFVVIGTATVRGANVSAAREEAIGDGLDSAVALMTAEILQKEAFVEHFAKLNELLFEQTSAFVRGYKVLTEASQEKSYRVAVQATVSGQKILKYLTEAGILRVQTALPSVLFLIAEQRLEDPFPGFWWGAEEGFVSLSEATMAERLAEAGFSIIDHEGARNRYQVNWDAYDKPDLTVQEAAELGSLLKADVVVKGKSVVSPSTNIMGSAMRSFNGTITARVILTESAEPILNLSRTAVAVNEDDIIGSRDALEDVGSLVGQALAEELTAAWQKQAAKPSQVEIIIRGTSHLANYVKFRKSLNTISGVGGIRVKEIKPNEAGLLVEYKGKTKDLAAALMQQNFESFGINIFEVTRDMVKVELIPN
jgi:hypothetical protein